MKRCRQCGLENEPAAAACPGCGSAEFSDAAGGQALAAPSPGRPWVGVLLSLLVPGLGIWRAGRLGRAVAWFAGLELGVGFVALALALEPIPFGLAVAAAAGCLVAWLRMLYESARPGRMTTRTWGALAALLVLSLVSPSLAAWVVRPVKVTGGSMRPTLHGGAGQPSDFIFVDRISYRVSAPRRGDLVVFFTRGLPSLPEDGILVKRIIGLPGERVEFRDGAVFAGGRRLTARDGLAPIRYHSAGGGPKAQPSESGSYAGDTDGYFVVGDNSANSLDSRRWGCVPRKNVYGKVTGIYYPFSRAGRPRYPGAADDFPKRDPGLPETR